MFVQVELTIRYIVQLQPSNDICRTEKYHSHFFTFLFTFWRGSCDVKWFDTAKVCQFRFNDLFHVVRSRCWFYSLPLFFVGSPPWLALVAAVASAALRSTGRKKETENKGLRKMWPNGEPWCQWVHVSLEELTRSSLVRAALTVAFCAAFLLSKAEPGPPRAALSQHFCRQGRSGV